MVGLGRSAAVAVWTEGRVSAAAGVRVGEIDVAVGSTAAVAEGTGRLDTTVGTAVLAFVQAVRIQTTNKVADTFRKIDIGKHTFGWNKAVFLYSIIESIP